MSTPSCDFAFCSPLYAEALKERSLRPPMSVTIATRSFLAEPPPLVPEDFWEPELDDESSEPHAERPTVRASRATRSARSPRRGVRVMGRQATGRTGRRGSAA